MLRKSSVRRRLFSVFNFSVRICIVTSMVLSSLALQTNNVFAKSSGIKEKIDKSLVQEVDNDYVAPIYEHQEGIRETFSVEESINEKNLNQAATNQFWLSDPIYVSGKGGYPYGSISHPNTLVVPAGQKGVGLIFRTIENTYGSVSLRGSPFGALNGPLPYSDTYCRAVTFQEYWAGPWHGAEGICNTFDYDLSGPFSVSQFGLSGPVSASTEDWYQWSTSGSWSAEIRYIYWGVPIDSMYRMNLSGDELKNGTADSRECSVKDCEDNEDSVGDPVNTYTGAADFGFEDLTMQTDVGAFSFQRSYSSIGTDLYNETLGYGWTHNHDIKLIFPDDDNGEYGLVWFKATTANQYKFVINSDGTYSSGSGVFASLVYDTDHYELTDSDQNIYMFDNDGKITSWTDSLGKQLTYEYSNGLLIKISANNGARYYEITYDTENRISQVNDHTGRVISFGYDTDGDLVAFTDANSQTWEYVYDDVHQLTEYISPNDEIIVENIYNTNSQIAEQYDGEGNQLFSIAYNAYGSREITYPNNAVTTVEYDTNGKVISRIDPYDGEITYVNDENFHIVSETDQVGDQIFKTWSNDGQHLLTVTDSVGNQTEFSYDTLGNIISIENARGFISTFSYNGMLITGSTDTFGNETTYTYDTNNHLASITDPLNNVSYYNFDTQGQLTSSTDASGNVTNYSYDGLGRIVNITNPAGVVTHFEYDNMGNVLQVIENYDTSHTQNELNIYNISTVYTYDHFGNILTITDTYGNVTQNEYDANQKLVSTTDGDGNITTYTYDWAGNILSETNPLNKVTTLQYDLANRLSTITTPDNNSINYEYNLDNTLLSVTDPLGRETQFTYDNLKRTTDIEDALGNEMSFQYDEAGNLISLTDSKGNTSEYSYDAMNNVIEIVDCEDNTSENFYDENGNLVQQIDNRGNATTYSYNELNQLVKITDAAGNETDFTYDDLGQIISQTDANGHTTTVQYDDLGRQIELINHLNQSLSIHYDALSRITSYQDELGREWSYAYDDIGQLIRSVDPMNGETSYSYDAMGNLLSENDVNGYTTTYTYDDLNRLLSITDANSHTVSSNYDAVGNMIKVTDAAGNETNYGFDALNRQTSITNAAGKLSQFTYDAVGNLLSNTDANGIVTYYEYDGLNNLAKVIENYVSGALSSSERNITTNYSYDENGNLESVVDGNNHTDTYSYNVLNQLSSKSDALGNSNSYLYDGVGNLVQVIDANNNLIQYRYDELNRLVLIDYPDPEADVTFSYDAAGQVDSMTDALGTTNWDYDDLGRPISITDPNNATVSYAYDGIGNRTGMIYPDGKSISYTYDPANRLTSVLDWNNDETQYTYSASNYLERVELPNGVFSEYDYDPVGRVTSLTHQTNSELLSTYLYSYDNVGNLVTLQELFGETIFEDGFESQDFTAWSSFIDNTDLSVENADPIYQTYSMQTAINDNEDLFVRDDSPSSETSYNARFYITPYYLEMADNEQLDLFEGLDVGDNNLFGVRLGYLNNRYQIMAYVYDENSILYESDWLSIGCSTNSIELGWNAASSNTVQDGKLQLWINNILVDEIENLDSDTQLVESANLGVMNIQGVNIAGNILFDEFKSSRQGFIGIDTAVEIGKKPDFIFDEEFEDGINSLWTITNEADIAINESAAIEGDYGLQVTVDGATEVSLNKQMPDDEKEYYSRFYFDPNSMALVGESLGVLGLYTTDSQEIGYLKLSEDDGVYQIQSIITNDESSIIASDVYSIGNFIHSIEVYWKTASSSAEQDGEFIVWVDGIETIVLSGLDTDQLAIGNVAIGAGIGDSIDSTASGSIYFDAYEDHRHTRVAYDAELLNPVVGVESPILWLDAAQMYDYSDGDVVSEWEDLSRNDNSAEQTSAGSQPEYSNNEVNGNPAILFDGSDDYLDLSNLIMDSEITIFIVAQNETQTSGDSIHRPILAGMNNPYLVSGTQYALGYKNTEKEGYAACLGDGTGTEAPCIFTDNSSDDDYEIHTLRNVDSDFELFRNGEPIGSDTILRFTGFETGYRIGAELSDSSQFYLGGVAEIIVYDRALSDNELDEVDQYLAEKYGLIHFVPTPTPTPTATSTPDPMQLPLQISDSVLWLDASQMYDYSDGDAISYWEDLSGNGNQAEQSTAGSQPIYTTNEINGLPALVFDGTDDYLNMPDLFIDSNTTIFIVAQNEVQTSSTSSVRRPILAGDSNPYVSGAAEYALGYNRSGVPGYGVCNGTTCIDVTNAATSLYEVYEFRKSGTDAELYRDGEPIGEGTFNKTSDFGSGYRIGADLNNAARRYTGGVAEIIVYNRALTDSEMNQLELYLNNKYGISIWEPTATPTPTATRTPGPTLPPMQVSEPVLWLDASQMYGYSDGDAISYWEDLSGNGNQAEQSTAGSQPIYTTNEINGLPALVFDGTDDYLNMPDLFIDSNTTIFIVAQNEVQTSSTSSVRRPILAGDSNPYVSGAAEYALGYNRSGVPGYGVCNGTTCIDVSNAATGSYEVYEFRKSGTDAELYRDGEPIGEGTFSKTSDFGSGYRIGADLNNAARRYTGGVAEIIVYNRALSDSEMNQLELYLNNKYSISIWEPTATPTLTPTRTAGPTLPPMQISDSVLWLDASQMYGYSDGDAISYWEDLSGNGNQAEQSTAGSQPIYTTNEANGLPALVFDGSDDYMNMPDLFIDSDTTIFIVAQNEVQTSSTTSNRRPILAGDSNPYVSGAAEYALGYKRSGTPGFGACNGTTCIDVTNAATGLYEVHEFRKSGTDAELYRDGDLIGENTLSRTSGFGTGYRIGADLSVSVRRYTGGVAEILVYNRALSDSEVNQIENYLSNKYGLGIDEPTQTPTPTNTNAPTATRTPGPTMVPMQISDSVLWLDASQMYGYSDGDTISYWEDLSGTGNDAEQTTANSQPVYTENEINGNPVIVFDGSDDYYDLSDLYIGSDTTVIIVAENKAQDTSGSIFKSLLAGSTADPYVANSTQYAFSYGARSGYYGFSSYLSYPENVSTTTGPDGLYEYHEFRKSGTDAELYRNGYIVAEGTLSRTSGFDTGYTLGTELVYGTRYYSGGIAEVIVYDRAITDIELEQLEDYLSDKYDIAKVEATQTPTPITTTTYTPTVTGTPTPSTTYTDSDTDTPVPTSTGTATSSATVTETIEGTQSGSVIDDTLDDEYQLASLAYDETSVNYLHVMARLDPQSNAPYLSNDELQEIMESGLAVQSTNGVHDQKITYTYDALNRLTEADYHDGTYFNYTYDAVGNILTEQTQDEIRTYTYDAADRISTVINNSGTFNYSWDGNGNLLSDGVATYTYNAADQMSSMTKGSDVYTYAYNGMGDRYEQTINGVSTTYQLDLAANLTQVLNDGDNSYLYGLDRIAQVSTTQTGYFLPDALGSVRQVVDPQAQIQLSRSYTPFGEELASSGSYETPFGFAGEMQDACGLLYLRARYLSTSTGRFTSVDPFSGYMNYPASMNPYQYAYNNPLRYVDPSGEVVADALLFIGSGAALGGIVSIYSQYNKYGSFDCIDWGKVGKAMLTGAVIATAIVTSLIVGILVEGTILTAGVVAFGDTLLVNVLSGAVGGVVAGQYARVTSNLILGRAPTEGLFQKDMLFDFVLGGFFGGVEHWIGAGFAKLNNYNSSYIQRLNQTPNATGTWSGKRGESLFMPDDASAQQILRALGLDGILYSDAIPDFKPVSLAEVTIENMTINRRDNFKEADKILAELWDVTKKDIVAFRENYKYTWHELNDMETMQLVPTVINDKCGHLGGVGEINIGNSVIKIY